MRAADAARVALGAALLAAPDVPVRATGAPSGALTTGVVRFLGARYVVQGLGVPAVDESWAVTLSGAVELAHAASLVGLAAVAPSYRRLSVLGAVVATGLGAADLLGDRG